MNSKEMCVDTLFTRIFFSCALLFMCPISDIDVSHPDEKSIMTYIAQFLQYSNDMPSVDDLEVRLPQLQTSSFKIFVYITF